jgi:hypothetical protein
MMVLGEQSQFVLRNKRTLQMNAKLFIDKARGTRGSTGLS